MKLTVVCSVSTFGLALAGGLGQGDMWLPVVQPPVLRLPAPKMRVAPLPRAVVPRGLSPRAFGNVMPHSYLIYGLRTGPGGMACTDRNGAVIPIPFNPQVRTGPFTARSFSPQVLPPTFNLPKLSLPPLTLPKPTPKK